MKNIMQYGFLEDTNVNLKTTHTVYLKEYLQLPVEFV